MNFRFGISLVVLGLTPLLATAGEKVTYLALGDSIAFGFDPRIPIPSPASSYIGYPETIAALSSPLKWLANLACPGQTSGSFLLGPLGAEPSRHCEFKLLPNSTYEPGYKAIGLHVPYQVSQMEEALFILNAEKNHMKAVSLNIGANDLILLQETCVAQHPQQDPTPCIIAGLDATTTTLANNVATILEKMRSEGGYSGPIALVTQYSPDYQDELQTGALALANTKMVAKALPLGVRIADAFSDFAAASAGKPCDAGLLVVVGTTPQGKNICDAHPSERGRAVLAATLLRALR